MQWLARMVWGTFFPTFAQGCKGLPQWFGALLFTTFARFTEGGGKLLFGYLGNAHIERTHFKKGLP